MSFESSPGTRRLSIARILPRYTATDIMSGQSRKKSDAARDAGTIALGGHRIELSNTTKVFFPGNNITKGDVIDYYRRVAKHMLPFLRDRPLAVQRFPDGIGGDGFYQKNRPDYFPAWIRPVEIATEEGTHTHIACQDAATLVYLANQASITFHGWLSRMDALRRPDQLIFDLDPSRGGFDSVRFAARVVRELLDELGCRSFCRTTGSRGLHIVVPLKADTDFDDVRALAHDIAELAAGREPRRLTTKTRKDARRGRLFIDYLRNSYAQHAVVPYSLRALPGAPVATPLDWSELSDGELDAQSWRIDNIFKRLGRRDDPWKGWRRHAVSAGTLRRRLQALTCGSDD